MAAKIQRSRSGSDYQRVATAIDYLKTHADAQPSLDDLATALQTSPFHLHRLFKRWTGITPKDFVQILTLSKAKSLLQTKAILEASIEVGLSGSSRLHDLFLSHEAMTPGEYKRKAKDLVIHWDVRPTPFGNALIAATSRGLCALSFDTDIVDIQDRWPEAVIVRDSKAVGPMADEVCLRMQGQAKSRLPLLLCGSAFQVQVWKALLCIPEGQVVSYQALAKALGMPQSPRAVGNAVAANQIGYLIPCHRVIKATGAVGQYRWGADRKEMLIAVEGARTI